mmetsp:Transcript_19884/g.34611  ORF Transcript_19884/g.34611 Transcript_19884/m.34611 type:complete len:312 (-) Transcript_19884:15-950(-)
MKRLTSSLWRLGGRSGIVLGQQIPRTGPTTLPCAVRAFAQPTSSSGMQVFDDEVSVAIQDGVAIITLTAEDGEFEWGTKRAEHRWNPITVKALSNALDSVETNSAVNVVVLANKGKYWSNGMDLKYLEKHGSTGGKELGENINGLMTRVCCFPLPTVAAISGHFCAAGGMMGLAFDFRVMSSDRGLFFIPGVDLGLVYGRLQMEVMAAKLPQNMHREVILFNSKRWVAEELLAKGAVDAIAPAADVLPKALEIAGQLKPKGQGAARKALGGIKRGLYKAVLEAYEERAELMDVSGVSKGVDRPAAPKTSKL